MTYQADDLEFLKSKKNLNTKNLSKWIIPRKHLIEYLRKSPINEEISKLLKEVHRMMKIHLNYKASVNYI